MYTLSLTLLLCFSLYISLFALFRWDASWLLQLDSAPVKAAFILIFALFLGAALLLAARIIRRLPEKFLKRLPVLCILLLAAGQLFFLFLIEPSLRYDPLKIFDMAVEMLETHTISPTYETGYFARYTNNYPLTILTYWFLMLLSKLGVPEASFMTAVQLVNIVCITLSFWIGYLIFKSLRGQRASVFYLAVCVLCPLSYVWAGYFYTATCSMPCLLSVLYLAIRLYQEVSKGTASRLRIAAYGALLGFLSILGFKLRATAAIALIAVAITGILLPKVRQRLRAYAASGTAFLAAAAVTLGLFSASVNQYVDFDYKNTGFPMVHWVMMGARWDGAFDQMDELYTSSFDTKEEKTEADVKVLKERIQEAGPSGLLSLAGRKLLNTWVDGTDSYQAENSYASYSKLYDYILGSKSGFLTIYSQSFRFLQMLTIGLGALVCLLRLKKKKELPRLFLLQLTLLSGFLTIYSQSFRFLQMLTIGLGALVCLLRLKKKKELPRLFLLQLTLLGAMAFHLLWETNPLYSISFTPVCLILLSDSLFSLEGADCAQTALRRLSVLGTAGLAGLFLLFTAGKKELVETPVESWNYSVDQYQYAGGYDGCVSSYDQIYSQTFTASKPFNRIAIRAVNPVGPYNQSAFRVKLTDENGSVLYENDRFLSGLVAADARYEFELPQITPEKPTVYTFEISPGYIEGENSLEFLSYNTGNCDMYPDGMLTVAGELQEKGDLAFSVSQYQVTTYFSLKQYVILCSAILIAGAAVVFASWKLFTRTPDK